jgi:ribonuclease-3
VYRVLDALGPDHDKLFRIEVMVEGEVMGRGEGPSRRIAETAAAAEALETLRARHHAGPELVRTAFEASG